MSISLYFKSRVQFKGTGMVVIIALFLLEKILSNGLRIFSLAINLPRITIFFYFFLGKLKMFLAYQEHYLVFRNERYSNPATII